MSKVVGEIAIEVGANVGPLIRDMARGVSAVDGLGKSGSRLGGFLGTAMGKVAAGAGVAAGAIVALTKVSMSNIDALSKQARAIGISVSSFQSMAMVAEEAGVESDKMSKILIKMQDNIASLSGGTKAQVAQFNALGLSIADLVGLGADEQFKLIAKSVDEISDPTKKTAAALNIFGESGADAITMLDGYSTAVDEAAKFQREFGISVTDEQAQGVEAANDAVGRLGMAFQGLGNTLAVIVAPAVEGVADVLIDLIGAMIGAEAAAVDFFRNMDNYNAIIEKFGSVEVAAGLAGGWRELEVVLSQSNALEVLDGMAVAYDNLLRVSTQATGLMRGDIEELSWEYPILAEAIGNMSAEVDRLTILLHQALNAGDVDAAAEYSRLLGVAVDNLETAVSSADDLSELDLSGAVSVANALATAFEGVAATARDAASAAWSLAHMDTGVGLSSNDVGQLMPPGEGQINSSPRPPRAPPLLGEGEVSPGGGGGGGSDPMQQRLEALIESLRTESEIVATWYEESLIALETASEAELAALGGKHAAMERLEEEHQARIAGIKEMGNQWGIQAALSGGAEILGALGATNKKALKMAKAFAAAEALVSTYQGAAAELKKGTFGFASAAAVIAKGIGFVAAIRGASEGGNTGGGGGSGRVSSPAAADPARYANITLVGDTFSRSGVEDLFTQINDGLRRGRTINLVRA